MTAVSRAMPLQMRPDFPWPDALQPGPEIEALRRFHQDVSWTGTVKAAGGLPEMTASGRGRFYPLMNGLWIGGDFEQDQYFEGRKVVHWAAHYIAGWHQTRQTYVAYAADSNGRSVDFTGAIERDRFTITSEPLTMGKLSGRLRMVWDLTDPNQLRWRNEIAPEGGSWLLIEEYSCTPLA